MFQMQEEPRRRYDRLSMVGYGEHVPEIGRCRGTLIATRLVAWMVWEMKFESDSLPKSPKKGWKYTMIEAKRAVNALSRRVKEILSAFH